MESNKTKILKILRNTHGYLSGQELCEQLGISRTAVWKYMKQLKEEGYEIQSVQNKGYCLMEISVPLGEELAKKTFNPRLGIVGGISILGTTGIVEPMSEQALVDTIRVELRQKRTQGDYVLLTPGNYGSDFIRDSLKIDPKTAVQVSNFIGTSLDICKELDFKGV